jgi:hypothetical protein
MSGKADSPNSDTYNVASISHDGVVHPRECLTAVCCGHLPSALRFHLIGLVICVVWGSRTNFAPSRFINPLVETNIMIAKSANTKDTIYTPVIPTTFLCKTHLNYDFSSLRSYKWFLIKILYAFLSSLSLPYAKPTGSPKCHYNNNTTDLRFFRIYHCCHDKGVPNFYKFHCCRSRTRFVTNIRHSGLSQHTLNSMAKHFFFEFHNNLILQEQFQESK